jgi:hypothetical protein
MTRHYDFLDNLTISTQRGSASAVMREVVLLQEVVHLLDLVAP